MHRDSFSKTLRSWDAAIVGEVLRMVAQLAAAHREQAMPAAEPQPRNLGRQ
ncbi:MAG TPA: hypothetical protein VFO14_12640 [Vicinamibacterales bacterium]|nr:hypothetical protein [Vicinamibacterales bacterium]